MFSAARSIARGGRAPEARVERTLSRRHLVEKGNSMSQPARREAVVEFVPPQSEMTVLGGQGQQQSDCLYD